MPDAAQLPWPTPSLVSVTFVGQAVISPVERARSGRREGGGAHVERGVLPGMYMYPVANRNSRRPRWGAGRGGREKRPCSQGKTVSGSPNSQAPCGLLVLVRLQLAAICMHECMHARWIYKPTATSNYIECHGCIHVTIVECHGYINSQGILKKSHEGIRHLFVHTPD